MTPYTPLPEAGPAPGTPAAPPAAFWACAVAASARQTVNAEIAIVKRFINRSFARIIAAWPATLIVRPGSICIPSILHAHCQVISRSLQTKFAEPVLDFTRRERAFGLCR